MLAKEEAAVAPSSKITPTLLLAAVCIPAARQGADRGAERASRYSVSGALRAERSFSWARSCSLLQAEGQRGEMTKPDAIEFERLVRAYLSGEVRWDVVHNYAVEMEWGNATDFPAKVRQPLEALHMAFLADERDDPQFRMDRNEISQLLQNLDRAYSRMPNA